MSDFLRRMAASSAARAAAVNGEVTARDFDLPTTPLSFGSFDLIAEIKERSPSVGDLATQPGSRADRARQYVQGGAAAISVLTEPEQFGGSLEHLREVVAAVAGFGVPVIRKDFLVDRRQVLEARAAGASGVLLIVAILDDRQLGEMLVCAEEHSLFVLLESFDAEDLARTRQLLGSSRHAERAERGQLLVGINTRDLRTLAVDTGRLEALAPLLPPGAISVAESGLAVPGDAAAAASLGYRAALVGSALMRVPNPAVLINDMLLAGRARAAA